MKKMWIVRSNGGELLPQWLENSIISIGWCPQISFKKLKKEEKIVELNAYSTSINVYDSYVYYMDIDDLQNTRIYRIKTNGTEKEQL